MVRWQSCKLNLHGQKWAINVWVVQLEVAAGYVVLHNGVKLALSVASLGCGPSCLEGGSRLVEPYLRAGLLDIDTSLP